MALSENVLVLLDILFSLFFVGPFTVLYWRGTFVTIYNFFMSGLVRESYVHNKCTYHQVFLHQRNGCPL